MLLAQGPYALESCNANPTLNGLDSELWGANKFISPNEDDFLLANTSYDSYFKIWGATVSIDCLDSQPLSQSWIPIRIPDFNLLINNHGMSPFYTSNESFSSLLPHHILSWGATISDEEELDLTYQAEPPPAEPPPSRLVKSTIQIPVIHLRIFPISTGSPLYVRIHLLTSSTRDSSLLTIITSSTAPHALRSFITLYSTAFEWGVLNYNRDNSVNQVKPDMTRDLSNWIEAQSESPIKLPIESLIESQKSISDRLNWIDQKATCLPHQTEIPC